MKMFTPASTKTAVFVFFVIVNFVRCEAHLGHPLKQPTVTNNDIRNAILQIVNVERNTEDKLERHEYRERVLGEHLKRGMISIDKRIKQMEQLKGAVTRLDERLATVETILMQKEEREKLETQRTQDILEDIQKTMPSLMEKIKKEILEEMIQQRKIVPPPPPSLPPKPLEISKEDFESIKKQLGAKIDNLNSSLNEIQREIKKKSNDECKAINDKTLENLDKMQTVLKEEDNLLGKYEQKLVECSKIERPPAQIKEQPEWQNNFFQNLNNQKQTIEELLSNMKNISNKISKLPNNTEVENVCSKTEEIVNKINQNTDGRTQTLIEMLDKKIENSKEKTRENFDEIALGIKILTNNSKELMNTFNHNADKVSKDLQAIQKVDEVMVQTADNVLDTKRRVEYGVHQIMAEISQIIKQSTKDISNVVGERFDLFEQSMIDEDNGAIANLTSKLGNEIDQVWRQIGMMHQKMNANADILTHLQNQTDAYVNGSSNVMDNMKGKVAKITKKIVDLDENLNYLMGRLMLVSREFNQIKTGLGKALDKIKGTFHEVQSKIEDPGPGPHKIENIDEEVDVTPQRKR